MKSKSITRYIALTGIAISTYMMNQVPYAFTSFYVAFKNSTGFSDVQLGMLLTVLGIAGTLLYFPGGWLADRFSTKTLLLIGYFGSGILGFGAAMMPSYSIMLMIYGGLAITTILFAWNPAFKAIRLLGSDEEQGKLTSVRIIIRNGVGLAFSTIGIYLFASMQTERAGMQILLIMFSSLTILGGLLVLFFFNPVVADTAKEKPASFQDFKSVMKIKDVWLIGLFGFGIYLASTSLVYIQPYMVKVYGLSTVQSSTLGVICKQMPIIAVPALTYFGHKLKSTTKVIYLSLVIAALCFLAYVIMPTSAALLYIAISFFIIASFCIMGSWAIQFIPIVEIRLPVALTGSAIGIVSIIGYLTDTFYFSLCGNWIENYELAGYRYIFMFTVFWLVVSAIAAFIVLQDIKKLGPAPDAAEAKG